MYRKCISTTYMRIGNFGVDVGKMRDTRELGIWGTLSLDAKSASA